MKGVSLPTQIVVYVLIAALVVVVVISLMTYFSRSTEPMDYQAIYNSLCLKLITKADCKTVDLSTVDINIQGKTITLQEACDYLGMDDRSCRENCGCRLE